MKKQTFALSNHTLSLEERKQGKDACDGLHGHRKKMGRAVAQDELSDAWLLARRPQSPARQRRVVCVNWQDQRKPSQSYGQPRHSFAEG